MGLLGNRRGFGVEDSPFMILAALAVVFIVVATGVQVMGNFIHGNQHQLTAEAAMEIYKRARLLSLAYDGSFDRFEVSVSEGYAVLLDGNIAALEDAEFVNGTLQPGYSRMGDQMVVKGMDIKSEPTHILPPGRHEINMTKYGAKIHISWV
ncbi:MAG: hypothetical protein JXB14_00440 [Candidatus Altiarchaeota archaeon]|nr:hypothetical protein [Candidatus Altiarchaeota archaeon]